MTMETDERVMLFKLITGELVIGSLNKEILENKSDTLFIVNPFVIVVSLNSFYLVKYNHFSKLSAVMIPGRNVVYVDLPNESLVALYQKALEPKVPRTTVDDEGIKHSLH